jgi:uncharacterized protein (DUF427 family)
MAMDAEVAGHPRDAHRIDALPSSRHVRVTLGAAVLAESRRTVVAFEHGEPLRFHFAPEDVDLTLLTRDPDRRTASPGRASSFSLAPGVADERTGPIAWTHADPLPEVAAIAGRIAFCEEHVAIEVDGEPLEHPLAPWAPARRDTARPFPGAGAAPVLRALDGGRRDAPGWRTEPSRRRVRGVRDGRTLVDSRRAVLVWAPDRRVPVYAFPEDDVHEDALWFAERVAPLSDHVTFGRFTGSGIDRWYEEDEQVFVHPRDPHVRVDALPGAHHVRVESHGVLLAETDNPIMLFETGLPTRWYLPPADVDRERLVATTRRTDCPYKGTAVYWSVRDAPPGLPRDVVWSYPRPLPAQALLRDRLAFYDEHVDVIVDGVLQDRPECGGAHLSEGRLRGSRGRRAGAGG